MNSLGASASTLKGLSMSHVLVFHPVIPRVALGQIGDRDNLRL